MHLSLVLNAESARERISRDEFAFALKYAGVLPGHFKSLILLIVILSYFSTRKLISQ